MTAALQHLVATGVPEPGLLPSTIRALGRLRCAAAAPCLIAHARSDNPEIRRAALEALVNVGGEPGRSALLPLAKDPDPEVRRAAVTALGELNDPAAIETLLAAHRDAQVRPAALAALVHMPDLRALDAYLDGLGGKDAILREGCRRAIAALRDQALPVIEAKADRMTPEVVAQLRAVYEGHSAARRGRLFASTVNALTPEDYLRFALTHPGDATRGRTLFHDREGPGCVKCHAVGGQAGDMGPDLSTVGAQFDRTKLAESFLYPNRTIREGYHSTTEATADGRLHTGLVRSESTDSLILRDAEGKDHPISKQGRH